MAESCFKTSRPKLEAERQKVDIILNENLLHLRHEIRTDRRTFSGLTTIVFGIHIEGFKPRFPQRFGIVIEHQELELEGGTHAQTPVVGFRYQPFQLCPGVGLVWKI